MYCLHFDVLTLSEAILKDHAHLVTIRPVISY